jgi:prevent-host-death family protein
MTMVMIDLTSRSEPVRTIAAGEFKAKCLAVMAEVSSTGQPVLVTKRGKPLARVLPVEESAPRENPEAIFGCLRHMATITGDIVSPEFSDEEWDRMFDEKWDRFEQGSSR